MKDLSMAVGEVQNHWHWLFLSPKHSGGKETILLESILIWNCFQREVREHQQTSWSWTNRSTRPNLQGEVNEKYLLKVDKTRVGLDFVTIQNRILKLSFLFLIFDFN